MKHVFIFFAWLLCFSATRADEVDQLILSYADNRREFDWGRIDTADRKQLVARLNELRTGERTTVAAGYGVGSRTAARMLIDIGDDDTLRRVIDAYHKRQSGTINVADIVELGQALALPYLAVDLVSDEFLVYDLKRPDGQVVTVRDTDENGKRLSSARNIVGIIENSRQFPQGVRESATHIKPTLNSSREEFIGQVADWWRRNERLILARRYAEVSSFAPVAPDAQSSAAITTSAFGHDGQPKDTADVAGTEASKSNSATSRDVRWLWMSAVALLVLSTVVFAIKRR